jgi:hypothetical protein
MLYIKGKKCSKILLSKSRKYVLWKGCSSRKVEEWQVDLSSSSFYTLLYCFLVLINLTKEIIFMKKSWKSRKIKPIWSRNRFSFKNSMTDWIRTHIKNATIEVEIIGMSRKYPRRGPVQPFVRWLEKQDDWKTVKIHCRTKNMLIIGWKI